MFRIHVVLLGWILSSQATVSAFLHPTTDRRTTDLSFYVSPQLGRSTASASSLSTASENNDQSVETAIQNRRACKAYERSDGTAADSVSASVSKPSRVRQIWECLNLARLAPTSFNTQPYKVVLVHSKAQKEALSQYCLSLNKRRVLDSECTAIFLADRQVLRTIPPFGRVVSPHQDDDSNKKKRGPPPGRISLLYIGIFSSGYPLPRVLAASLSFFFRTAMGILDFLSSRTLRKPLPSLSNAETWTTKQTSMVAMTFMLACAAQGIATTPMEGINAAGIRRVIGAPRRYSIPLIVSAGRSAAPKEDTGCSPAADDRRYAMESILFGDHFNEEMLLP
jgi:nitroreductase